MDHADNQHAVLRACGTDAEHDEVPALQRMPEDVPVDDGRRPGTVTLADVIVDVAAVEGRTARVVGVGCDVHALSTRTSAARLHTARESSAIGILPRMLPRIN